MENGAKQDNSKKAWVLTIFSTFESGYLVSKLMIYRGTTELVQQSAFRGHKGVAGSSYNYDMI